MSDINPPSYFFRSILFLAVMLLAPSLPSATRTWTGNANDLRWSSPVNWQPVGAPQDGDTVYFPGVNFQISVTTSNDISGLKLDSIRWGTANTGSVVGNPLVLSNGIDFASTGMGPGVASIQCLVTLGNNQSFGSAGLSSPRLFLRNVDLNGFELLIANGGDTTFLGTISGIGRIRQHRGDLFLDPTSGTNTFVGSIDVHLGGRFHPRTPFSLGPSGNSLQIQNSTLVLSNITLHGISLGLTSSRIEVHGASDWGGPIAVTNNVTVASTNLMVFSGGISGPGMMTLTGGEVEFSGNTPNTFTGGTVVQGNRLRLNKTGVPALAGPLIVYALKEVVWMNHNQAPNIALTIYENALVNQNNFSDQFDSVGLFGGVLATGSGVAILNKAVTVSSSSIPSQISGSIQLPAAAYPNNPFIVTNGVGGSGGLFINAAITGTGSLIKRGPGTVVITGPTSYSGTTFVDEGVLESTSAFPLGSTAGSTIVQEGATLSLNNNGSIAELISIRGSGSNGTNGALYISGAVHVRNTSPSIFPCLSLTTNAMIHVATGARLTADGFINGFGPLTKSGPGTLVYSNSNANVYFGDTTVREGTLELRKPNNVVAVPGSLIVGSPAAVPAIVRWFQSGAMNGSSNLSVNANGLVDINGNSQSIRSLRLNDGGDVATGAGTLNFLSGGIVTVASEGTGSRNSSLFSGRIGLPANEALLLTVAPFGFGPPVNAPELDLSASIPSPVENVNFERAGIWKNGAGEVRLTGNNTFNGRVDIAAGTLTVGSGTALGSTFDGTFVANDAVINLVNGITVSGEQLLLNSTASAALQNRGGHNTWTGPITLGRDTAVTVNQDWSLQTLGVISGSGALIKLGAGALTLAGGDNNTHSGNTIVEEGLLNLAKSPFVQAIPANLVVGKSTGPTGVVRWVNHDQVWQNITVNETGFLLLNGFDEYAGSIVLNGSGGVDTGAGALHIGEGITVNPSGINTAAIHGRLGFAAGHRTINVGSGGNADDFIVYANVFHTSTPVILEKTGPGKVRFAGTNTYTGTNIIFAGTVQVDGSQGKSPFVLNGGTLMGAGSVGSIDFVGAGNVIAPGSSPGTLNCGRVNGASVGSATLQIELNGATAGLYDRLLSANPVNLSGITLQCSLNFPSALNNQFMIIEINSRDSISGTFTGLPQNAEFYIGDELFQINYAGGTGNDVVLTRMTTPRLTIERVPPDSVKLLWSASNPAFVLQSRLGLGQNWASVTSVPVTVKGNFVVTNAASDPNRYYRLFKP